MISKDSLFSNCLSCTDGDGYLFFSNQEGKAWIVPSREMRAGMALYQPGGIKGKLVKTLLPFLYWIPGLKKVLRMEKCSVKLDPGLEKLISSIFKTKNYSYSFFSGTPCVHQKTTIQIFDGEQILGYVKCSFSEAAASLFLHEKKILESLNKTSLKGRIPECLHCGVLGDGINVFVQNTVKTLKSSVVHKWSREHESFLEDMVQDTGKVMPFEDTDLYESICFMEGCLSIFPSEDIEVLSKAIRRVKDRWGGKKVSFSMYHGDFTPWNMFVEQGRLFVFDFEYAGESYPPMLDRFHFLVQTGIFEKHLDATEIYREYLRFKEQEREWRNIDSDETDIHFLCYLLDITSRFARREKGVFGPDVRRCINIWLSLIAKL